MSFVTSLWNGTSSKRSLLILACIPLLYAAFIYGLSTNPPGFYLDESCEAYNAYSIARTGVAENGTSYPLFVQCYTEGFTQWMSPALIYMMSVLYTFVAPSTLSAHIFSATLVFIAILLLGVMAARISGQWLVGSIVAVTAMATPWLFEVSRFVQETSVLTLAIVLFLFCLHNAYRREQWKLSDNISVGLSLGLVTYSYAAGRVLAVMFAFGLLIFAINRRALLEVFKTWSVYVITLIPFLIVYFTNGDVITARFREVSYMKPGKSVWEIITEFVPAFFMDMSPNFLLLNGDPIIRHHIQGMGEIFAATFLLAIAGLIIMLLRHRGDAWWRFILYGLVVSILPGAITLHRYHSLRLLALPIFLLILTVPALSLLLSDASGSLFTGKTARRVILAVAIILTIMQAIVFQSQFWKEGPKRIIDFNATYPAVLDKALAEPLRPIYLRDGYFGPAYIHALWYATIKGVGLDNFVHIPYETEAPPDSLVLASDKKCTQCNVIYQDGTYVLYRTRSAGGGISPNDAKFILPVVVGKEGPEAGQFTKPRGVTSDNKGNFYVADSQNSRIEKFDSEGKFISVFGTNGSGEGEIKSPNGLAVDENGNIYASDSVNHKLVKFDSEGKFVKEWKGTKGFYGPRDITIGPDKKIYIIDQGLNRIAKFDPVSETFIYWGEKGDGDAQFSEPTGIAFAGDLIIVVDTGNKRIQIFDLDGTFVRQWKIPAWEERHPNYPDAVFDEQSKVLFVSNGTAKDIIAFDIDGKPTAGIKVDGEEQFTNPSAMCIMETPKSRSLIVIESENSKVFIFPIWDIKQKK